MTSNYRTVAAWEGTLGALTLSLMHDGRETSRRSAGNDALERGLPLFDELLTEAQLKPGDVQAFVCSIGPGAFTGLRITLSTVKALAAALGVPLIGVSSFDVVEEMRAMGADSLQMPHATVISPRSGIICARLQDARGGIVVTASGRTDEKIDEIAQASNAAGIALAQTAVYEWPAGAWKTAVARANATADDRESAGSDGSASVHIFADGSYAKPAALCDEFPSSALLRLGLRRLAANPPDARTIMQEIHAVAADYGEAVSVTPPRAK